VTPPAPDPRDPEPVRARLARGALGRGCVVRGALELTIGRSSIACSREQIGQFWIRWLWRQNVGTSVSLARSPRRRWDARRGQSLPSRRLSADPPTFDLQSHSLHSDGSLEPNDVVAAAARAGVELLALSDHDTVDGVASAAEAAAELGLRLVPAVEISSVDGEQQDLHMLGYLIDHRDPALRERLEVWRADRDHRAEAMAEALRELGYEVDESGLERRRAEGKPIGRPHLADAVVQHPANKRRLESEGLNERSAFLEAYLIDGKPAFRPRTKPTIAESITAIHDAGGVAVWAHPFWDMSDPGHVIEAIDRFRAAGLDGVECFYATHTREQAELIADRCSALGLLTTGSSDFHGPEHRLFSRFRAFSTYGRTPVLGPIAG
jgi:3',5'-nucleoside bisphosphate phosphatase